MFEFFFRDRLVQLLSSSMYVQQQYITFFWLSVPLLRASGAFQFPSDALFNHHSSTKLGGRGIKLIFATPPFLDMFFQLWLKDFSVGFLIFLMMGLGTCFYFFFFIIVCLLSILVQKVEPVETEFFSFFCFLNLIFLFSKDRHPYYVFWGKSSHFFTGKITEDPKNQFLS